MTQRIPWQLLIVIALAVSVVALRYRPLPPDIDPGPTPSAITDTAEAMQLVESRLRSELYNQVARDVDSGKIIDGGGIQEALRNGNIDIARRAWLPLDELAERSIPEDQLDGDNKQAALRYLQQASEGFERASKPK